MYFSLFIAEYISSTMESISRCFGIICALVCMHQLLDLFSLPSDSHLFGPDL